jgi:hypothetical protein
VRRTLSPKVTLEVERVEFEELLYDRLLALLHLVEGAEEHGPRLVQKEHAVG